MITETEALASYGRLNSLKDNNFAGTQILATTIQDISNVIQYVAEQKKITAIAELKFNSKDKAIAEKVNSLYDNINKLELSDLEIKNRPKKNEKILESTIKELINIALNAYDNRDNNFYLHPSDEEIWKKAFLMVHHQESYTEDIFEKYALTEYILTDIEEGDKTIIEILTADENKTKIYNGMNSNGDFIIKGAIGGKIWDGSYTGIQTIELKDSLENYSNLYFIGSFGAANEVYPNVYVKFGFKGDTQGTYNRIDTDFLAYKLNDVTKVKPVKTEKGEECYQITFPDIDAYNTLHQTSISIKDFHYISFFVVNATNGNFASPYIIIEKLWLEPKEG